MTSGKIDHVEIYVSSLSRSSAFWGWLLDRLGYTPYQDWGNGRSWRSKEFYFVLVQVEDRFADLSFHRKRIGLNHLAFRVSSREAVDQLAAEMDARSIQRLYGERHPYAGGPHHYAVYCEDPDRIKVEIVASE